MNHTERRNGPRTSIRRLAYVNLEPYDNGGVITDISRDGLRFHMVKPVEQGGIVRLSIVLGTTNQLHVVGEVMWMDATRKIGGVRFTLLPDGAADQFLKWAEALNSADASSRRSDRIPEAIPNQPQAEPTANLNKVAGSSLPKPPAAPAQAGAEPNARSAWIPPSARPYAGAPTAPMHSPELPAAGTAGPQPGVKPARIQQPTAMPWITHFDPDPPVRGSSFVRGMLAGFLLCALLGSAAWFARSYYGWMNSPVHFNIPLAPNPVTPSPVASQPDLPSAPSAELPNSAGTSNPTAPAEGESAAQAVPSPATPDTRSNPTTQLSTGPEIKGDAAAGPKSPVAALAPASQLPRSPDSGEAQLMLARQYLNGHVQPRNPTVASRLLWSAVEKGSSAAEMDLADLYLHGDGVARNCDQARVLLSAASSKGNVEAMQKLGDLNRTGCR
jgi:PilZ domain